MKDYLCYRKGVGYADRNICSYLKTFDRYLYEKNIQEDMLTPSFFLKFRSQLNYENRTINMFLLVLSKFFQYLVRRELYDINPLNDIPPLAQNDIVPFVFTPEETDMLVLDVCQRIRKNRKHYFKDVSIYLAILLMARCGLRISEPLRLKTDHYRSGERSIYIEKTKFSKDRLIPVPNLVAREIENFISVKRMLLKKIENPYLLVGERNRKLHDQRVRIVFHQAVGNINLNQKRLIIGNKNFSNPTPHSLRHSFAINTLKKRKQDGKDPHAVLPVLSVYMGHIKVRYTSVYLKLIDADQRQKILNFAKKKKK